MNFSLIGFQKFLILRFLVINVFLNTRDALDKFDARSNESIFVGYSTRSKIFKIFNKKTITI